MRFSSIEIVDSAMMCDKEARKSWTGTKSPPYSDFHKKYDQIMYFDISHFKNVFPLTFPVISFII